MKVIVMDHEEQNIIVLPVPEGKEDEIQDNVVEFILQSGVYVQDCSWMVADDDVPIFWGCEPIPFTSI